MVIHKMKQIVVAWFIGAVPLLLPNNMARPAGVAGLQVSSLVLTTVAQSPTHQHHPLVGRDIKQRNLQSEYDLFVASCNGQAPYYAGVSQGFEATSPFGTSCICYPDTETFSCDIPNICCPATCADITATYQWQLVYDGFTDTYNNVWSLVTSGGSTGGPVVDLADLPTYSTDFALGKAFGRLFSDLDNWNCATPYPTPIPTSGPPPTPFPTSGPPPTPFPTSGPPPTPFPTTGAPVITPAERVPVTLPPTMAPVVAPVPSSSTARPPVSKPVATNAVEEESPTNPAPVVTPASEPVPNPPVGVSSLVSGPSGSSGSMSTSSFGLVSLLLTSTIFSLAALLLL